MTWKTLFPDTSVWMTQGMVRAGYEGQKTWKFIWGLLLTCTLLRIAAFFYIEVTDPG